ncbi:methyltransferase domain-containing protein [archaeon]|jgi:SAM-dependent methyltransferase|nr:methyltransferase domain-containing protein [archaeon]NDB55908.1 methyltransferase domain-containing protein [archaeon]NDB79763.1 methyltransferase domain-containing protein [archaeon]
MNKLLNQKEFANYQNSLSLLQEHCPEMLSRKIPQANIQQAFTLQTALDLTPKGGLVLSAGSWEDTATETLKKLGYNVTDVDPMINSDLKTYFDNNQQIHGKLDSVVSTSVIEHVHNDEEFIDCICKLLKSGGYGIVTMDYNNGYLNGGVTKPNEDVRLYTEYDLRIRLNAVLEENGCELLEADYSGENDFNYAGHWYTFATFVFKKK